MKLFTDDLKQSILIFGFKVKLIEYLQEFCKDLLIFDTHISLFAALLNINKEMK